MSQTGKNRRLPECKHFLAFEMHCREVRVSLAHELSGVVEIDF
jgi:hypothetical protein